MQLARDPAALFLLRADELPEQLLPRLFRLHALGNLHPQRRIGFGQLARALCDPGFKLLMRQAQFLLG